MTGSCYEGILEIAELRQVTLFNCGVLRCSSCLENQMYIGGGHCVSSEEVFATALAYLWNLLNSPVQGDPGLLEGHQGEPAWHTEN